MKIARALAVLPRPIIQPEIGSRGPSSRQAAGKQALADYLQARPLVPGARAVFVTTVAPRRAMTRQGIGQIVRTTCARSSPATRTPSTSVTR